ncbi:MAG TPA: hypothetical protein DEO84_10025 [candidate division Zixibacteria bacterium]|nr:hypothetical protein [candidate division Zixibacteria bacterium]HBZ01642.1 hypothetical protein [candidate division Zixibacteria bacterium]
MANINMGIRIIINSAIGEYLIIILFIFQVEYFCIIGMLLRFLLTRTGWLYQNCGQTNWPPTEPIWANTWVRPYGL